MSLNSKYIGEYAGAAIDKIKAEANDLITSLEFWGLDDLAAQKTCAYIDGVNDLANRLVELIKAEVGDE